ncbi:MAG: response regulator [Nocardioides sp.]|uniref:response regulator transcription factor n=1 Tax=Nocardioides sp. TaxID=35761 RepID=UPI0039E2E8B8
MTEPIEIVIVEHHPASRLGIRARLDLEEDIVVVGGEAAIAEEALPLIGDVLPDVAVVDLSLPGADGVSLTRDLAAVARASGSSF